MEDLNVSYIENEICPLLSKTTRADVRQIALNYLVGVTGSEEGCNLIGSSTKYLSSIAELIDDERAEISKDSCLSLINLTANKSDIAVELLNLENHKHLLMHLMKRIESDDEMTSDLSSKLLANLTRSEEGAKIVADFVKTQPQGVCEMIELFGRRSKLHRFAPLLLNLSQMSEVRNLILSRDRCVVQRLLPYIQSPVSQTRFGVVGTLKNCCFQAEHHEWLLGNQVDILPRLLLPLAGPEDFDEDDTNKLPEDLQYLGAEKTREPDAEIRTMLIQSINQLCATAKCRRFIKDKNTYVILRELHKWETDPKTTIALENLISLLIDDEPQPGMENLNEVAIPEEIGRKFTEHNLKIEK